jgi:hypothetical protein
VLKLVLDFHFVEVDRVARVEDCHQDGHVELLISLLLERLVLVQPDVFVWEVREQLLEARRLDLADAVLFL